MAYKFIDLGIWERYEPDPVPQAAPPGAMFARRVGDGLDWYAFVQDPANNAASYVFATALPVQRPGASGNLVSAVQRDPQTLWPVGVRVFRVEGVSQAEDKPHRLFEGQNYDPEALTVQPFPLAPQEPPRTFKTDLWARCTEEEAAALYADLQDADVRMRAMFEGAQYLSHGDALFADLKMTITGRVGAARAAVILAPS